MHSVHFCYRWHTTQVVLVLWLLFEVALLFHHHDLEYGMERFDELADIFYHSDQ